MKLLFSGQASGSKLKKKKNLFCISRHAITYDRNFFIYFFRNKFFVCTIPINFINFLIKISRHFEKFCLRQESPFKTCQQYKFLRYKRLSRLAKKGKWCLKHLF